MTSAQLAALGAVLSGFGSLLSALVGAHMARKTANDQCDKRVKAIAKAFKMGLKVEVRKNDG